MSFNRAGNVLRLPRENVSIRSLHSLNNTSTVNEDAIFQCPFPFEFENVTRPAVRVWIENSEPSSLVKERGEAKPGRPRSPDRRMCM